MFRTGKHEQVPPEQIKVQLGHIFRCCRGFPATNIGGLPLLHLLCPLAKCFCADNHRAGQLGAAPRGVVLHIGHSTFREIQASDFVGHHNSTSRSFGSMWSKPGLPPGMAEDKTECAAIFEGDNQRGVSLSKVSYASTPGCSPTPEYNCSGDALCLVGKALASSRGMLNAA